MNHFIYQIRAFGHKSSHLRSLGISIYTQHQLFLRLFRYIVAHWSNWEIHTLEVIVNLDFYFPSMVSDKVIGFPLFSSKVFPLELIYCDIHVFCKSLHQDIKFKGFIDTPFKTIFLKFAINGTKCQFGYIQVIIFHNPFGKS